MMERMLTPTLGAAQAIDTVTALAVLPVTAGTAGDAAAWFIITESSDSADAVRREVNWSPALARLRGSRVVQRGRWEGTRLVVGSGVDFAPARLVRANADSAFPPAEARPGSVGESGYSPIVEMPDGTVLNAPVIAASSGRLDRIVQLDRALLFAVVSVSRGYSDGRTAWYISTDASDPAVAALERATYAPKLALLSVAAPGTEVADARLGLVAITNGPTRAEDAVQRHGLRSLVRGEGDPQNILEALPDSRAWSPLWDLHLAAWSARALRDGTRERLLGFTEVAGRLRTGALTPQGAGIAHPRLSGLVAAGVIINCPVLAVF